MTVPLLSSFQASSAPISLLDIAYLSLFICCTRHLLLLLVNSYSLHSLSLSTLDVPSFILCCLNIYIIQQLALRNVSQLGLVIGPRSLWGVNAEHELLY